MALPVGASPVRGAGASWLSLNITSNQVDYDLFAALGSPTRKVRAYVYLDAKVTSSSELTPAWIDTGLTLDSEIYLVLSSTAEIKGHGGTGAAAWRDIDQRGLAPWDRWWHTSGAGGAGDPVGQPGAFDVNGAPGNVGTLTLGGAGGDASTQVGTISTLDSVLNGDGIAGGDAMSVSCVYTIDNLNEIWAGGGGGAASFTYGRTSPLGGPDIFVQVDNTAGGAPGQPGGTGASPPLQGDPGAGGYAVRLLGGAPAPTFVNGGSDPDLKGAIGA